MPVEVTRTISRSRSPCGEGDRDVECLHDRARIVDASSGFESRRPDVISLPARTDSRSFRAGRSRSSLRDHDGQVMSEWDEPTTRSTPGAVMCNALTVVCAVFAPSPELVCSLMITAMPPGNEMAVFGFEFTIRCPATVSDTN